MSLFSRIAGVINQAFQLSGPSGPTLNALPLVPAIEVKDSTNAVLANMRVAAPLVANDAATKAYVDANSAAGAVKAIDFSIGLVNQASATSLPAGAIICRCDVQIQTIYSPGATIAVGVAGTPAAFQATTDNDPQVAQTYQADQRTPTPSATQVEATIAGAPVAGTGFVTVYYSVPNN